MIVVMVFEKDVLPAASCLLVFDYGDATIQKVRDGLPHAVYVGRPLTTHSLPRRPPP